MFSDFEQYLYHMTFDIARNSTVLLLNMVHLRTTFEVHPPNSFLSYRLHRPTEGVTHTSTHMPSPSQRFRLHLARDQKHISIWVNIYGRDMEYLSV